MKPNRMICDDMTSFISVRIISFGQKQMRRAIFQSTMYARVTIISMHGYLDLSETIGMKLSLP